MNRKDFLLGLRQEGKLKGKKPCFVTLKLNRGKIYNEGTANFVMSYKDGIFYFQRLSFFGNLKPKLDFQVNAKRFNKYAVLTKSFMKTIILYDKAGFFLDIHFQTGTKETFSTEDNIFRIIKHLEEKGLKQIVEEDYEEEPDTEGEGTD